MVTSEVLSKEQVFVLTEEMKMRAVAFDERAKRTLLSKETQEKMVQAFKDQLLSGGEGQELLRILHEAEDQVVAWNSFFKRPTQ